jgi:hypothetical protein
MSDFRWLPWRSVRFPQVLTAFALLIGLPLFLRSPPWCDITLYQLAARNLLHGGVHYRDLFDTNLPGFVWIMTAISAAFGPSVLAVRTLDIAIAIGAMLLLDRLVKQSGATLATRWWMFAGAAAFYPFTNESAHAQRDLWMALPGFAAVVVRLRRGTEHMPRMSILEGMLWGCGVWLKPHIVPMAAGVWLLTAWRLAANQPRPWRAVKRDLLGNILGGLIVALPGVTWLYFSGAWASFLDVFQNWNPQYMRLAESEFDDRLKEELHWFPPWSLGLVPTVPLAVLSILDMAPWRSAGRAPAAGWVGRWLPAWLWDDRATAEQRFARGVIAGLYLIWAVQAFFVQRAFLYVHIPETLLMMGLWAAHRWAFTPLVLLWLLLTTILGTVAGEPLPQVEAKTREHYLPVHPIANVQRLRQWPACWRTNLSDAERYELYDRLRLMPPHEAAIGWGELSEVADWLREHGAGDGEVIAWNNSPHAVYLLLDREPGFRFMHVYTASSINFDHDPNTGGPQVMKELRAAKRARFVVSDLQWVATILTTDPAEQALLMGPPHDPPRDLLPTTLPMADDFPFNQPTLFRSRNSTGRYVVHRIVTREDTPRR